MAKMQPLSLLSFGKPEKARQQKHRRADLRHAA